MTAPTPRTCCKTGTCFTCEFWEEKVRRAENGDTVPALGRDAAAPVARVNGWHYIVKPFDATTPKQYLGLGGTVLTFRFTDGRQLTSNDVMCQGEIPAHFRDRLPDNAVIVPQSMPETAFRFGSFEGLL
ncbi:hypothetical protein OG384_04345 [Streptomyces sp. NBC_01324]|uniref:hypothetical protein n=1 Tax=Streptomyces sp. NBC_01324 TaxID=2903826 RepID=UPI002E0F24E3|nr:hypothetical protein OG384_04345 [Streptomyces sp. NBC_01324]